MTISVVCPHCESRFQLNPDMLGKAMRCPDCREVFEVRSEATSPQPVPSQPIAVPQAREPELLFERPAPPAERPYERVETDVVEPLREDLPIVAESAANERLEAIPVEGDSVFELPVSLPEPPVSKPSVPAPPAAPALRVVEKPPPAPPVPKAVSIPTAPFVPPPQKAKKLGGPKEVAWTGEEPGASKPSALPPLNTPDDDDDEPYVRRRRRKPLWRKLLPPLLVVAILGVVIASLIGLLRRSALLEDQMAADAETAYKEGNYPTAQKRYEELETAYPDSANVHRYHFFAKLAETHAVVGSVTARENPLPGQQAFEEFVKEFGTDALAQPETGYGTDVVQAGKRLLDTLADYAADRLKAFQADRTKLDELAGAEKTVADGRTLLPIVDRFRDNQGVSLDAQRERFEGLAKTFAAERHRLAVLAPYREMPNNPTAAGIEEYENVLKDNSLANDAEARAMLSLAEKNLRATVVFKATPVAAGPAPTLRHPPVLFASPVFGSPRTRATLDVTPDVVFAVVRGVLYALDAQTGVVVWGTRLGPPTLDPRAADVPTRITLGDGATDWVLVTDESGLKPSLTARVARTGEPVWYQALPSPALARPVVIGGRVYLPLRDKVGTVVEFDALTGTKVGELTIRQPIGTGLAVVPGPSFGESYLVIPADAYRVFVFGIGAENARGTKLPPRCVRVFQTDHPRDSLRGEPVPILSSEPTGPRLLVFTQADGPTGMKLRAFPLPSAAELAAGDPNAVDQPTPKSAEVVVPGWTWFPPVSDGERIVLATDAGAFLAFGINQLRNADKPLFALPGPPGRGDPESVARSQVVAAEEDSFWVVIAGNLVRLRTAVDAVTGFRILPAGNSQPVGEPVHRPQLRPLLGLGVVVARSGAAMQAFGFDLGTGQLRWQQRLGLSGANPPASRGDGSALIADEDGGAYLIATGNAAGRTAAETVLADPVAAPLADLAGRATAVASDDGKALWVLAPELPDRNGKRLRVRLILNGVLKSDTSVPVPEPLAGLPILQGNTLLIPLGNGYLHRFTPGDTQLTLGPLWRSDSNPDAVCHLSAIDAEDFLVTDGGRRFVRWKWPTAAGAKPTKPAAGAWEMKDKLTGAPVAFPSDAGLRFAAADQGGAVFLFSGDLPGDPIRRWFAADTIPAGSPGALSAAQIGNRRLLLYAVDRRSLVAIDPEIAQPLWVAANLVPAESGELTGWRIDSGRVIAADQSGRLIALDAETGKVFATIPPSLPGTVASGPAVPVVPGEALMPLADGTTATVPLPPKPLAVPE